MRTLVAVVVGALLFLSFPALAQEPEVPIFSTKRLSGGLTIEHVTYRPEAALAGLGKESEFKVGMPLAYNLGRYSSLQAKVRYGASSAVKEYSVGITFHVLARGARP